jgi:DNA repair protein RadA/Sms
VVFGEISLSGEVRPVSRAETRLKEAAKLGFARALTPSGVGDTAGVKTSEAGRLADAVRRIAEQTWA